MQIWAESGKSALPICNYSQILYQFLTFTQNLKRSQIIQVWNYVVKSLRTFFIAMGLATATPNTLNGMMAKYSKFCQRS